jgi:hypothetical protein
MLPLFKMGVHTATETRGDMVPETLIPHTDAGEKNYG